MRIKLHKKFIKGYAKLPPAIQEKFIERRELFLENPHHPILNNHALHGEYARHRSINITGDIRVIFRPLGEDVCLFYIIGTHSELYG